MQKESKLYLGDCLEIMPQFETDSIDAIVTDPPYGLSSPNTKNATKGFMNKSWDICPSIDIWRECLRVLKPGAFAFIMCIPRQDCLSRMICRLEDAGFNVAFSSIYWTYASGFPKAQNLSKVIDKRAGAGRPRTKEISVRSRLYGERPWIQKAKEEGTYKVANDIPITKQAKALDGAYGGCQMKPAVEIVIVAMKPLEEKTYIDQAIADKHGCTWLDECRIPYLSERDKNIREKDVAYRIKNNIPPTKSDINNGVDAFVNVNSKGRFPANVLCEDDVLNDGIERKSGAVLTHHKRSGNSNLGKTFKIRDRTGESADWKSNSGEYSRYFSLDAWFAERIKHLPKEAQKTFPWLIVPKASKSEKDRGLENLDYKEGVDIMASVEWQKERGRNPENYKGNKNNHPTCKPIKLMSWLITLASREGDIVLDPFCGGGTTAIAAKMLGRQYICIELEKEFFDISVKRIDEAQQNMDKFL